MQKEASLIQQEVRLILKHSLVRVVVLISRYHLKDKLLRREKDLLLLLLVLKAQLIPKLNRVVYYRGQHQ